MSAKPKATTNSELSVLFADDISTLLQQIIVVSVIIIIIATIFRQHNCVAALPLLLLRFFTTTTSNSICLIISLALLLPLPLSSFCYHLPCKAGISIWRDLFFLRFSAIHSHLRSFPVCNCFVERDMEWQRNEMSILCVQYLPFVGFVCWSE